MCRCCKLLSLGEEATCVTAVALRPGMRTQRSDRSTGASRHKGGPPTEENRLLIWTLTFGAVCSQIQPWTRDRLRVSGSCTVVFPKGVRRVRIQGSSDWSFSRLSSNRSHPREWPASWDGPVMCVLVNSAKALLLLEACEQQACRCSSATVRGVTAKATQFIPICWILAERIPTADSVRQIETDVLLAWWFQRRLDHSSCYRGGYI